MSTRRRRWVWFVVAGLVAALAGGALLVVPALNEASDDGLTTGELNTFPSKDRGPVITLVMKPAIDMDAFISRNGIDRTRLTLEFEEPDGTIWSLHLPNGMSVEESRKVEQRLERDPDVRWVEGFSPAISLGAAPNDPKWGDPGGDLQWGLRRLRPEEAWGIPAVRADDPSLVAMVVDGPVDRDHEDLVFERPVGAQRRAEEHGTFVSGLLAAQSDNGAGVASPAWRQTLGHTDMFCKGCGFERGVRRAVALAGLDTATAAPRGGGRRVVVNASFCRAIESGLPFQKQKRFCDPNHVPLAEEALLLRRGFESGRVLWVLGAGNDRAPSVGFPARHPYAVAVAASDPDDQLAHFSNWGPGLDLLAPGKDVGSTVPGGGYEARSGTSYAAPLVSGVAVALWKHEPQLQSQQVMKRLLASGRRPQGAGRTDRTGYGVVDMHRAFTLDRTPPTVDVVPERSDRGSLRFQLRVVDDLDPLGVSPIDEQIQHTGGVERFTLDFAHVPTSSIAGVRWSVDGGPWHDVPIDTSAQQPYRTPAGALCQVCTEITVPAKELRTRAQHRLVVRAWDSSSKVDVPGYTERVVNLAADGSGRASGSAMAVVVDRSRSMEQPFGGTTRITAAKRAARDVVELARRSKELGGRQRATVVPFSGDAVAGPVTDDFDALASRVDIIVTDGTGTNIGAGLTQALSVLADVPATEGRSIVLLSDGEPTVGDGSQQILKGPVAEAARQDIPIHTVAFGDLGAGLLRHIAETTGGVATVGGSPVAIESALVTAGHRASGFVVSEQRGREVTFDMPADAAGLRVTAVAGDTAPGRSVRLVSPSGRAVDAPIEAGPPGTPGVAVVAVPDAEPGTWRLDAPVEVDAVASAQPGEQDAADPAPPPDPEPPAVVRQPRLTAAGPELRSGRLDDAAPWALVALGAVLVLAGVVQEARRRAAQRRLGPWLELVDASGRRLLARSGDRVGRHHEARLVSDGSEWFSVALRAEETVGPFPASVVQPGDTVVAGGRTLTVIGEAGRPARWPDRLAVRAPSRGALLLTGLVVVQVILAVQLVLVLR